MGLLINISLHEFFEKSLAEFQENVTIKECQEKLGLENIGDFMPGMRCALMAHQVQSVSYVMEFLSGLVVLSSRYVSLHCADGYLTKSEASSVVVCC